MSVTSGYVCEFHMQSQLTGMHSLDCSHARMIDRQVAPYAIGLSNVVPEQLDISRLAAACLVDPHYCWLRRVDGCHL